MCYVAQDFDAEMDAASRSPDRVKDYRLPDGNHVVLGNERFRCCEVLFSPALLGRQDEGGIQDATSQCITKCEEQIRKQLYANVVLSGGNTLFPGFGERI